MGTTNQSLWTGGDVDGVVFSKEIRKRERGAGPSIKPMIPEDRPAASQGRLWEAQEGTGGPVRSLQTAKRGPLSCLFTEYVWELQPIPTCFTGLAQAELLNPNDGGWFG